MALPGGLIFASPPASLLCALRGVKDNWNGVRVVEGARLESVYRCKLIEGSNPSRSAKAGHSRPEQTQKKTQGRTSPGAALRLFLSPDALSLDGHVPGRSGPFTRAWWNVGTVEKDGKGDTLGPEVNAP